MHVKQDAYPVASNKSRSLVSQREELKKELDRLVYLELIASVGEPTDLVSTLMIAQKKSGE